MDSLAFLPVCDKCGWIHEPTGLCLKLTEADGFVEVDEVEALKHLADRCEGCGGVGVVGGAMPGWNTDNGPDFYEEPCGECFAVRERLATLSKAGA
jgi:hypothetical protein